ncbi:MAG: peptidase domain-containing ABC transporter [Gomphosphaeria aponina SAG 52.96 = DSM 107014]|uniref:Peptidase domain-containing ABC transporter n=1 Tax=Gomphosphaeria aponina SAG 52.96 = DSM 107014 TaxID=1521640 RepID=A0A941GT67_9CHRO|nr:peptidase domain-containing ABC transporter [Gomphosphaeria aponina SAG 52.96 = DSM 107014]
MKYPVVLQHSEEDCGAACLASITKYYGRIFTLTRIREAIGTGQLGTTLLGIRRGAESLGFYARSVATSSEIFKQIQKVPLPAIIHWQGNHWVILYGKVKNKYIIGDPALGIRYLSEAELAEDWTDGIMLLLQLDPTRFFAQPDDKIEGLEKFFLRLWSYRLIIIEALLCSFVIGLLSLGFPFFLQILTDEVMVRGDTQLLTGVIIAVILMYFVKSGLSFVENILIAYFAERLELGLVLEFAHQILRLPLTYYETRRSGEVISRLRDIQKINSLISKIIISLPSSFLIAFVSLILMMFYSIKLTLLALTVSVLMTLTSIIFKPSLTQKIYKEMVLDTENQGILVETFKGAITLKTTSAISELWEELQIRFGRLANLVFSTTKIEIINRTFSRLISEVGATLLLGFGSLLVINRELSIGQLLAFTTFNRNFTYLITDLIDFIDDFIRAQTANLRLQEVINATPETEGDSKKSWAIISPDADIICTNVNFHYPGRVDLLENFSLTIPGGKVTAIIGKSGCGKSTLAKLISGLYVIKSGNIRFDIYNLEDLALECLRKQVILVPQEAHFWSRSIIDNFRLGSPQLTFEQIVKACQIVEADEFISKLPEKYRTILGEFGSNLSGGQRQRLALARAIATNPPILILDESTAGLDPISETKVLEQLLSHRQDKTTILISHRPQVIQRAEWIIFLEEGQLKFQGLQSDLLTKTGEHLDFLIT